MKTIIIVEKPSQARDLRAAVGSRFGENLPAEGHLTRLAEPDEVNAGWKRWSCELLKPDGLYPTRAAREMTKSAKLKAIAAALKDCDGVILATDCDREGQLIGQEILEHLRYRGPVRRALFTAQDPKTLRQAFERLKPNAEMQPLYQAAVARQQADQIFNLSLTRTATKTLLAPQARGVIGIGRVKTPTLAIVCMRELEILNFKPEDYFEVEATATVAAGNFRMRHAPPEARRIKDRERAEAIARAAAGFEGPITLKVEDKRRAPPKLFDLPALQKHCSQRWGWTADRTLSVAQELYDGDGKKLITYGMVSQGAPNPSSAGTAEEAARWGGSSAVVGMAANPSRAHKAVLRLRRPGMAGVPVMSSGVRAGSAALPARPCPAMIWLQLAQSRPPPALAAQDRPASKP